MRAYAPTLLLAALSLVPQQPRPRAAAAGTSEEIRALVSRQYTAFTEGNSGALQALYADAGQLVFFPLGSARQVGAGAHVQSMTEFRTANGLRWTPARDVTVLPLGTAAALSTASFRAEGTTGSGQAMTIEGRHTAVWQRSGRQWRIVHEHMSTPWSAPVPTTAPSGAPQIVAEVLASYEAAWSSGDASALAALWDDEGDIGTLGTPVSTRGLKAVTDFWSQTIARRRAPTVVHASTTSARGIAADSIAADGVFEYRTKSASATAPPASFDRFSIALRRGGGRWKIAMLRIASGK